MMGHLAPRCTAAGARSWRCRCASSGRCWWCYRPLPSPAAAAWRPPSASCRRRGAAPASSGTRPVGHLIARFRSNKPPPRMRPLPDERTLSSEASKEINWLHRSAFQTSSGKSARLCPREGPSFRASFSDTWRVRAAAVSRIKKIGKSFENSRSLCAADAAEHLLILLRVWHHQEAVRGCGATWGRRQWRRRRRMRRRRRRRGNERRQRREIFGSSTGQWENKLLLKENLNNLQ